MGGGDATAQNRFEREQVAIDAEPGDDVGHRHLIGAGVHERPQGHVARGAGEAVEPGGAGHRRRPIVRAMAQAAPKPLSMPTTLTPLAHDACIASSAVTPASPAP